MTPVHSPTSWRSRRPNLVQTKFLKTEAKILALVFRPEHQGQNSGLGFQTPEIQGQNLGSTMVNAPRLIDSGYLGWVCA